MTHAPLPDLLYLLGALLRRRYSDADIVAPWRRDGEVAGLLSGSTWSLTLIAEWRKQQASTANAITVWFPDYFCNASLAALRTSGARLVFYPVSLELEPDYKACRELAANSTPDLFVLVHYFGRPTAAAAAREFCVRHGAWLVEDAVHVLKPVTGIGVYGDFVLYSPHKHLPLPDGAILVARPSGANQIKSEKIASFGDPTGWSEQLLDMWKRSNGFRMRHRAGSLIWLARRVLQKLGVQSRFKVVPKFAEANPPFSGEPAGLRKPSPSGLTRRLLPGLMTALDAVARQRQRHQLLWDVLLLDSAFAPDDHVNPGERPIHRQWTPYLATYRIAADRAEETYYQWQNRKLPVSTWPDLPPEVTTQRTNHRNAWYLRHSRLYLPVHQSLSVNKVRAHFPARNGGCRGPSSTQFKWDTVYREQWQNWLVQVGKSNLLQSWSYGEAKAASDGWQVRHGVFHIGDSPTAIVQILQKRVGGLLRVVRINRGPLWLRERTEEEEWILWRELGRFGRILRGSVLSVAPESPLSGACLSRMLALGFRQYSYRNWESAWIDLAPELDELRKRLDGKWRNMLVSAEKAGLELEVGTHRPLFEWMMDRYRETLEEKKFHGLPVRLLTHLYNYDSDPASLLILRALHESEHIAGICLARHGVAGTYLLGWNGPEGRRLKASQFLLWQAIVQLKHSGYLYFDVGGIDDEQTPGIAAFKSGLRGERYALIGEWLKW